MVDRVVTVGDDFNLPAAVNATDENLPDRLSGVSLLATFIPRGTQADKAAGQWQVELVDTPTNAGGMVRIDHSGSGEGLRIVNKGTGASITIRNGTTELFSITSGGLPRWAAVNEQSTVGGAGAAVTLPLTPAKYLKVKDSAGNTYVIPAYNA